MPSPFQAFARREPAVLSLSVLANRPAAESKQSHFEVLVRHLLRRFFQNEAMATEEDAKRTIQLGSMVALPGLLVALYLLPSYHAYPIRRTFWPQVSDHYFYITYSLVVMGIVTLYEADLLFPDLLDVFVLSSLPIAKRRLFFARIAAIGVFLGLVLLGSNSLGILFLPAVADLAHPLRHLLAHLVAVSMSGIFASAFFLALQGVLFCVFSARILDRILPLVQAGSIVVLLTVLFLFPVVSTALESVLKSNANLARVIPGFWFLGIYECVLGGSSTLPVFRGLAQAGCIATLISLLLLFVTYPLAYRRRVRQLIEGPGASNKKSPTAASIGGLLHKTVLRLSSRRATFHFVNQSLLRIRHHRVILALHVGLAMALVIADLLLLRLEHHHLGIAFSGNGIRSAIPVIAFWTVTGLRTAVTAPIDRRGSWIFRAIVGRPSLEHLRGTMVLASAWSLGLCLAAVFLLRGIAPAALRSPLATWGQVVVAIGCSLLLADILFLKVLAFPLTALRRSSIADLPIAVLRYFVIFPAMVAAVVHYETWLEASFRHLAAASLLILCAHAGLRWIYRRRVAEMRAGSDFGDSDDIFQTLGLRD